MDLLRKKVAKAQRRLNLELFLCWLPWCLTITLAIAAALVAVDKFWPMPLEPWAWPAGAVAVGVVAALAAAWAQRRDRVAAAIELDRRFGLRERVSTCLSLDAQHLASPAGQAVLRDAEKHAKKVDVAERFGVSVTRWAALPLAPAAVALAVALLVEPWAATTTPAIASTVAAKAQVKKSTAKLKNQVQDKRRLAEEQGLKEAQELLRKLEESTAELAKGDIGKKDALAQMNDLSKQLEERRKELAGSERVQDQMQNLKGLDRGPADPFAQALKQGDFEKAAQELSKLKTKLAAGQLDAKAQEELAKQLQQLSKEVKALADEAEAAKEALKDEIAAARRAGRAEEADALEQKLQQLEHASPQMKQLKELAEAMSKSGEKLSEKEAAEALQQLEQAAQNLSQLEKQSAEAKMLQEALDEMAKAKSAMVCPHCKGAGCPDCQGDNSAEGTNRLSTLTQPGGSQAGRNPGGARRPGQPDEAGFYDSKVDGRIGRGGAVITDFVDGPNARGRVEQEISAQFQGVKGGQSDPLTDQTLPRGYREHAQSYFHALRGERDKSE